MKEVFIIGSGSSLLNLTKDEISYINKQKLIISFNKYLLFYYKVGIIPTHYLVLDTHSPAEVVLYSVLQMCRKNELRHIRLFLHKEWEKFLFPPLIKFPKKVISDTLSIAYRLRHKKIPERGILQSNNTRFYVNELIFLLLHKAEFAERITYVQNTDWLQGGAWAEKIEDTLFHYRGTLTDSINLATIISPGSKIKLLGIDLDSSEYFFQDEMDRDKRLHDWSYRVTQKGGRHQTITEYNGSPGIQKVFPRILENVRRLHGDVVCCNPTSYLVKEDILSYECVIPAS